MLAEPTSPVISFLAAARTTLPAHRRPTLTTITAPVWMSNHLSGVAKSTPIPQETLGPLWLDCDDDDDDDDGDCVGDDDDDYDHDDDHDDDGDDDDVDEADDDEDDDDDNGDDESAT